MIARLLTKMALNRSEDKLIKMAGAPPLQIDGRVLDTRMHVIGAQATKGPAIHQLSVKEARKIARKAFKITNAKRVKGVRVKDISIKAPDGAQIPIRHYSSKKMKNPAPALLYFHMGGWVIGDLDSCDNFCSLLSHTIKGHVFSVDYRLAPEHKFPVAMEDAMTAYLWLRKIADDLKISLDHIAIGGDSAGGCMSAVLCQEMQRRGKPQPKVQMLIYPATDLSATEGSMKSCENCQPLTKEVMEWFAQHWLNDEKERQNPLTSPMHGEINHILASALIVTAGFDPLRDQGEAYAKKLKDVGVHVDYHCEDSLAHAFCAYAGLVPEAQRANERIASKLKTMLEN